MGTAVFQGCTGLTSLPQGLTSINDYTFSYCTSLTNISLPQEITSIGDSAFEECTSLASIIFNSATTEIYDSEYTIPTTAKIIGYDPSTAKTYADNYHNMFEAIGLITGVSLNKNSTTVNVGGNETLIATISPTNATLSLLVWLI